MSNSDRLAKIKLLVTDVDGTLTEGTMLFLNGEQVKSFHVHDGLGIRLAITSGLDVAVVTGNISQSVTDRTSTLGLKMVYQGVKHKSAIMDQIAAETGLSKDEIAYIGDDINDLPAFEKAGFRIVVANATEEIRNQADMVVSRCGGNGAVREAIEAILKARGQWEEAIKSYLTELEREDADKTAPEAVA